jgi:hypothetical protein
MRPIPFRPQRVTPTIHPYAGKCWKYTQSQLNFLRDEGCDEVQGYLLGKPMSAADLGTQFPDRMAQIRGAELKLIDKPSGINQSKKEAEI